MKQTKKESAWTLLPILVFMVIYLLSSLIAIFVLAGAFAQVARDMGAVDETVSLGLKFLPGNELLAGVFLIACFISISIGTLLGTIAAIAPMAKASSSPP